MHASAPSEVDRRPNSPGSSLATLMSVTAARSVTGFQAFKYSWEICTVRGKAVGWSPNRAGGSIGLGRGGTPVA